MAIEEATWVTLPMTGRDTQTETVAENTTNTIKSVLLLYAFKFFFCLLFIIT